MEKQIKRRKTNEFIKIKQLARICEKYNIVKVKWGDVEVEMGEKPKRLAKGIKYETDGTKYLESPNLEMPPDDVMLFAATPHFENILDERAAAKEE